MTTKKDKETKEERCRVYGLGRAEYNMNHMYDPWVPESKPMEYPFSNKLLNKEERCKNCQIIENGSIIKVDTNSCCIFCGREVGVRYEIHTQN